MTSTTVGRVGTFAPLLPTVKQPVQMASASIPAILAMPTVMAILPMDVRRTYKAMSTTAGRAAINAPRRLAWPLWAVKVEFASLRPVPMVISTAIAIRPMDASAWERDVVLAGFVRVFTPTVLAIATMIAIPLEHQEILGRTIRRWQWKDFSGGLVSGAIVRIGS